MISPLRYLEAWDGYLLSLEFRHCKLKYTCSVSVQLEGLFGYFDPLLINQAEREDDPFPPSQPACLPMAQQNLPLMATSNIYI